MGGRCGPLRPTRVLLAADGAFCSSRKRLIAAFCSSRKRLIAAFCSSRKRLIAAFCSSRKRLIAAFCSSRKRLIAAFCSSRKRLIALIDETQQQGQRRTGVVGILTVGPRGADQFVDRGRGEPADAEVVELTVGGDHR